MKATPVKDAYDATPIVGHDGVNWLRLYYTDEDKDPWKFPKILQCGVRYYRWMSFDSDKKTIHYKECKATDIAYAYKKR